MGDQSDSLEVTGVERIVADALQTSEANELKKIRKKTIVKGELTMKKQLLAIFALLTLPGCAFQEKHVEQSMAQPINCATSEGDIRVLESEKAHVARQVVAGATSIVPAGMVLGLVTGTAGTKFRVATGEYNQKIDERVAEIKRTCGA